MEKLWQNIPGELKSRPQWVVRRVKMPISPKTGQGAKAGVRDTWGSWEEAVTAYEASLGTDWPYDGIGFEFDNNGLVGIDLDHVVDAETGELSAAAWEVVRGLSTYTEISPSGTGLHLIAYGDIPDDGRQADIVKDEHGKVLVKYEIYKAKRYLTMTGDVLPGYEVIGERKKEVREFFQKYFPDRAEGVCAAAMGGFDDGKDLDRGLQKDKKLIALWNGERRHGNESSDDIALMNKLAFWCNCDLDLMVEAFRRSPYCQQKDEAHQKKADRTDYLPRTAKAAIAKCRKTARQSQEEYEERQMRRISAASGLSVKEAWDGTFINPIGTPEARARYTLDDIGTARLFADTFRGVLRYLPEYKDWFVYENGHWRHDMEGLRAQLFAKMLADYLWKIIPRAPDQQTGEVVTLIDKDGERQENDDPWKQHRKYYGRYRSLNARKTLLIDSRAELPGSADEFDKDPFLFNCLNGTLDLRTGELRPHHSSDLLRQQANVNYDPAARCSRFEQFIDEITESDKERADALQRALGYTLKGEANEECYFTAIGEKTRNGKGTLFDTMMRLMGSYGAQISFDTIARGNAKDGSRATPDLARLVGVRFVLSNEPEKGVFLNEALVKQLTGNDDITVRPLYGNTFQFKPVFRLFITANSKPSVADDSVFASGRIMLLNFPHHFSLDERDTSLKGRFRTPEALSGILNWLFEGYRRYEKDGLKITDEMNRLQDEYRWENDVVGQYLSERVILTPEDKKNRKPVKALLCDYRYWCDSMGFKPLGFKSFRQELERHDVEVFNHKGRYPSVNAELYDQTG